MAHDQDERRALGKRLAAARALAGFTMQGVADALTANGYPISKQGVGHWESGRNVPDAVWLKRIAKLYQSSADALLWDESLSAEAMKIAAEYDHLPESLKATWRLLWLGFITGTAKGGDLLPLPPQTTPVAGRSVS